MPEGARSYALRMRSWEPKETPRPSSRESLTDEPGAEGGLWEHYGPAVLAVVLVVVTAGLCGSLLTLR